MAYRGVHFALTDDDVARVAACTEEDSLVDLISEDIEERYLGSEWACATDKAWDPIHRCLGNGELLYQTGPYPLTYAVLGGIALDAGEDYTACLTTPRQVADVAEALHEISEDSFRHRFAAALQEGVLGGYDVNDFEYVWTNLVELREFLERASKAKRHVLFTVDA